MSVLMEEFRRTSADKAIVVDVNRVNGELTIILNGLILAALMGPDTGQDNYNRNITSLLIPGENIVTWTLVSLGKKSHEVSLDGSVSIGAERINLSQQGTTPPGLFYQVFLFLEH